MGYFTEDVNIDCLCHNAGICSIMIPYMVGGK